MKSFMKVLARGLPLLAFVLIGAPAIGQSTIASQGLGVPVEPQDARTRGMGGASMGFAEPDITWANPASVAGLVVAGMSVSYQYDNFTLGGGGGARGSTARVPLLLAAFPAGQRVVIQVGFGGFFDQNWRYERPDTLLLGSDTVPVLDIVSSEGGINRLRLAATYTVAPGLGVALGLDRYSGSVERVQGRVFGAASVPECCRSGWTYGGVGITGGAQWAPSAATGLGASVSYGGVLEVTPREDADLAGSYDVPLQVRLGGSGHVGEATLVAVGATWAGWSGSNDTFATDVGARDSWSVNAGVEWDGVVVRERPIPLRLGARTSTLPFGGGASGGAQAAERALSTGLGVLFGGGALRADTSFEMGSRSGSAIGVDQSFWRLGFSVRVLGR